MTKKQTVTRLDSHEKECQIRYEYIQTRLEAGNKKFDKMERMLWAIYPFILASIVIAKVI